MPITNATAASAAMASASLVPQVNHRQEVPALATSAISWVAMNCVRSNMMPSTARLSACLIRRSTPVSGALRPAVASPTRSADPARVRTDNVTAVLHRAHDASREHNARPANVKMARVQPYHRPLLRLRPRNTANPALSVRPVNV